MSDVLGSKYVENTKVHYELAEEKDTSKEKDVTPQIVSKLRKTEIANKIQNDIKVNQNKKLTVVPKIVQKNEEKKSTAETKKNPIAQKVEEEIKFDGFVKLEAKFPTA